MLDPDGPARGYALLWPREVFRAELGDILASVHRQHMRPALKLLFTEALRGPDPIEDLEDAPTTYASTDWTGEITHTTVADPARNFGQRVLDSVDRLPVHRPRQYFGDRQAQGPTPEPPTAAARWSSLQRSWAATVEALVNAGYLDRLAGDRCEDQKQNEQPWRIAQLILEHCGYPDQWPLDFEAGDYDRNHFLTLVEVFHDLVARPRVRNWHNLDEHYWYEHFDEATGQAVYRWKVNELLNSHGVELQLTDTGEDRGFLVYSPGDPRQELIEQVRATPDDNTSRIDHSIALFRKRDATVEDKRSACAALANVLEDRRKTVLEKQMIKGDEGPLFEIANRFAIRHHRDDQMYDYDEAFLDWIFWWYLSTVDLTNRLIDRGETAGG